MHVFISWSQERSHRLAVALHGWLPEVIQQVQPWVSSKDIDKGQRWSTELATRLEGTEEGIICITPENISEPWLNFEAGALAKSVEESRVRPVLLGLKTADVTGPFAQFQTTSVEDPDDMLHLVRSLNHGTGPSLDDDRLVRAFERTWEYFSSQVDRIREEEASGAIGVERPLDEMVVEILERVRSMERRSLAVRAETVMRERDQDFETNADVQSGAIVEHARFGVGEVIEVTGAPDNTEVLIRFQESGTKRLLAAYAPLKVQSTPRS